MKLLRTDHKNIDFQNLVKTLNLELSVVDGELHDFYSQFNGIESLEHVVVAYKGDKAIGCGAFKYFDEAVVEIKRMYTPPSGRKKGTAAMVGARGAAVHR